MIKFPSSVNIDMPSGVNIAIHRVVKIALRRSVCADKPNWFTLTVTNVCNGQKQESTIDIYADEPVAFEGMTRTA